MMQKVKLAKEAIFDYVFPCQFQPRRVQSNGLGVVMIDGILNGIRMSLEGFADLLP
jgi:hypothetical protein